MTVDGVLAERIELFRDAGSYNSQFNHDASDKMKLIGLGELPPPASCFICGNGTCEAGYVNCGVWAEFVGNLLICTPCLTQMSELIGCLAPIIHSTFLEHIAKLQKYAEGLELQLASANDRLTAFDTLFPATSSANAIIASFNKDAQTEPEHIDESVTPSRETKSDDVELTDESGRESVPDPTAVSKDPLIKL